MKKNPGQDVLATIIGMNLKAVRKAQKMSLESLAHNCQVSVGYLSAVEQGHYQPSLRILLSLAKQLDVPFSFFLEGNVTKIDEAQSLGYIDPLPSSIPGTQLDVILTLASIYIEQDMLEQAQSHIFDLSEHQLTAYQVYLLRSIDGKIKSKQGKFKEALVSFRNAAKQAIYIRHPELQIQALYHCGVICAAMKQHDLAIQEFKQCISLLGNPPLDITWLEPVWRQFALSLHANRQYQEATLAFENAQDMRQLLKQPECILQLVENAERQLDIGRGDLAKQYADSANAMLQMNNQQEEPPFLHLHYAESIALQPEATTAQRQQSVVSILNILKNKDLTTKMKAQGYYNVACVLLLLHDLVKAEENARIALELTEENSLKGEIHLLLARIALKNDSTFEIVQRLYQTASSIINPAILAEAYAEWADILAAKKMYREGLYAIKQAIEKQRQTSD